MDELSRELTAAQEHLQLRWAPDQRDAALAHIRRKYLKKRLRRRVALAGVTAAAAALLGLLYLPSLPSPSVSDRPSLRSRTSSQGPQPAVTVAMDSSTRRTETVLADGSRWQPLTEASQVVVSRVQPGEVSLQLKTGSARFDVVHRPQRVFKVQARDITVSVLGTRFGVELLAAMTRVTVERGRVQVSWPEGDVVLRSQQSRSFPHRQAVADQTEDEQVSAAQGPRKGVPRRPRVRQQHSWRELARQGRYDDAYRQLESLDKTDRPAVKDEARDLFLAADSARLSGHPEQAVPYLKRIVERHTGDARAALAAFTLGRVYLDDLGQLADAAAAFAKARALGIREPLAENALAREAEALWGTARLARARARTEAYLQRYPHGKHADRLRARLVAPRRASDRRPNRSRRENAE